MGKVIVYSVVDLDRKIQSSRVGRVGNILVRLRILHSRNLRLIETAEAEIMSIR